MILILYVISKYKIMTYVNDIYSLFENVVAVAFQNTFQFEIHQNVVFFLVFFKKLFLKSTYQNDSKHIKKLFFHNFFFLETLVAPHFQTVSKYCSI